MSQNGGKPEKPSRRLFLAAASGLAGAAGFVGSPAHAATLAAAHTADTEPFFGVHQGGITTPMQSSLYFAAFDLTTNNRADVVALMKTWTEAAARLTAGLPVAPAAPLGVESSASSSNAAYRTAPQAQPAMPDSGESAGLSASRLTITFGFGPELFIFNGKDRYNLAKQRPAALVDLPLFNGDQLVDGMSGGALCIQACAEDAQVAFHAVRQLARLGTGVAQMKWVQSGFSTASKTKGTPRNLMGFKDGTMNPLGSAVDPVVWAGAEGGWMQGGSYMVARRIRIFLEHWDRMKVDFQEQTFGRHKASGAPIGGHHEFDTPDFKATDKDGNSVIADTAHARLGAAVNNNGAQILRRSYSYNDGANFVAERWPPWHQGIEYDSGLFFQAFQKDPRTGFIQIFDKMSKLDMLNQFTTHVGSAVFACPPGVKPGGYIGQTLLETA